MSSVLGVTVGESAVRIVRPIDRTTPSAGFQFQVVDTGRDDPARLAAQTLGVLFQTGVAGEPIDALGVVYRDAAQADRIRKAMAEQGLERFDLVSESEAALAYLRASGELCTDTAVFYDLGDSGLTVTVVDLPSGEVLAGRTDTVGGRVFDAAIREHQLGTNGVWLSDDPATVTEFDAQCREAKEQLSASDAVAVPGAAGLILMSRDTFDPLIAQCPIVKTIPGESAIRQLIAVLDKNAAVPLDSLAYRFDIVLRGARSTWFESQVQGQPSMQRE